MNKICTNLEQSKRLQSLGIDIKTADMDYIPFANNPQVGCRMQKNFPENDKLGAYIIFDEI